MGEQSEKRGSDATPGRVYLVGVGRMGRLVARCLAAGTDLVLVGRDQARLEPMAKELGVRTASVEDYFEAAAAVVLALPGEVTAAVAKELTPRIPPDAVVINIATGVLRQALAQAFPEERLAAAKFVGHYYDMEAGGKALVVVEGGSPRAEAVARQVMGACGPVVSGREEWVLRANRVAAEEGVRAAIRISHRLKAEGIPEEIANLAVTAVAVGCIRAFMDGKLGPFGQVIADRVQAELAGSQP